MAQAATKKSGDRQSKILLAASRAQRKVHIIYIVLALIFAGALGYLLVRVAISLFEAPEPVQLETSPVEVRERTAGETGPSRRFGTQVGEEMRTVELADLEAASGHGFGVLRAHDVRTEAQIARDQAGTEELDDRAIEQFRQLVEQAERLLDRRYDYNAAVRRFEAALALSGIPFYEREIAVDGLERAQVFRTVISGVTPFEQTHRVVRYTPPGAEPSEEGIVGLVAREVRNWRGPGRVRLKLLEAGTVTEERITSRWQVEELAGEALAAAKAKRVHHQMSRLARLRAQEVLSPTDLLEVAVLVLETGDFTTPDGEAIDAQELTHACLAQAYDLCQSTGTSLTETVLLRRDPMFAEFLRLQPRRLAITQQMPNASRAERERLEAQLAEILERSQELLATLVRRYPQAWDFRHLDTSLEEAVLLERFKQQAHEEAEREAEALAGDTERASQPPEDVDPGERMQYFREQGERHMERGYDLVRRARGGELPAKEWREAYSEAVEHFFTARDYFRQAHALAPDNEELAEQLRVANQEITWTRREMTLGPR